jgi:hypothetical protein
MAASLSSRFPRAVRVLRATDHVFMHGRDLGSSFIAQSSDGEFVQMQSALGERFAITVDEYRATFRAL